MNLSQAKECMDKKLESWNIGIKNSGNYILYDLTTKKNYFFDSKFESIVLKFALNL